jgi:uncharacterized membrane protein
MNDLSLEIVIGKLLRTGVLLSAGVVLLGGVFYLYQHGHSQVEFHHFTAATEGTTTVSGILRSAGRLESEGFIQLGLLILIATPVARVALAVCGFAVERDWLYVGVSLTVLIVLVASLMHAT